MVQNIFSILSYCKQKTFPFFVALKLVFCGLVLTSCNTIEKKTDYSSAMNFDVEMLDNLFEKHKETALHHRRFKHQDIDSLIKAHQKRQILTVTAIGKSVQGRSITELSYGDGKIDVMLWSQMHGDEPTATMALFDIFNFLETNDKETEEVRTLLKEKLKIHFIPMLNPDGAEIYQRRNAQSIDLNRDARATETVEGKILTERAKIIRPQFAFNLHDQNIYYNVPNTSNPVSISLLAPAYNDDRDINITRGNAMKIIVGMNKLLQDYIPNAVAKYDDTHSPRGFGDNFQKWGASTILIESGGLKGDVEKQQIRKFNFAIILNALLEIAQGSFEKYAVEDYEKIPFNNSSLLHDVLIRNLEIGSDSIPLKTDIAIRRAESTVGRDFFTRGYIEDLGDLSASIGYEEIDADGLKFAPGKVLPSAIKELKELSESKVKEMLTSGFLAAKINIAYKGQLHNFPIMLFTQDLFLLNTRIELGGTANFSLVDKNNHYKYAILNGYLIDISSQGEMLFKNRIY